VPELDAIDATRLFHRETDNWPGETPGTVSRDPLRGPHRLDFTRQPPDNVPLTFKEFVGLPSVELSVEALSRRTGRATEVLARPQSGDAMFDAGALARVLAFSAGITRVLESPRGKRYFRAASSAHSYPDLYVVCGDLDGVPAGVYYFHGLHLRLDRLRTGDFRAVLAHAAADESITRRAATVVVVGVPWRAAWRYAERALRHVYWDTGGLLANMVAVAEADGIEARIALGFIDADVKALVGVDGVNQFPVALATFGRAAGSSGTMPAVRPLEIADPAISTAGPIEFPLITAAHRSGDLRDDGSVAAWRASRSRAAAGSVVIRVAPPSGHQRSIEDVILHRGSTRRMLPDAVPAAALDWALAVAVRPAPGDWVDDGRTLLEHVVLVHAVDGRQPGLYRLDAVGLRLDREGDFREDGRHVSLDQAQGGDGAYTTFHLADLGRVIAALGPRGYRASQVEGGYVLERLHLAAFAAGVGATGLTFFDEAVSTLCGTSASVMTEVAVGMPAYRATRGALGEEAPTIAGRAFDLYVERDKELQEARTVRSGNTPPRSSAS
jgi:SagB-type dehydrogenase family enzyme